MGIRKVVLFAALLFPFVAMCAEDSGLKITGTGIHISQGSSEVLCGQCTVKLAPNQTTHIEAARISVDKDTGTMYLDGGVRVTFLGGGELRAEHVAVKTNSDGVQELSGSDLKILRTIAL